MRLQVRRSYSGIVDKYVCASRVAADRRDARVNRQLGAPSAQVRNGAEQPGRRVRESSEGAGRTGDLPGGPQLRPRQQGGRRPRGGPPPARLTAGRVAQGGSAKHATASGGHCGIRGAACISIVARLAVRAGGSRIDLSEVL